MRRTKEATALELRAHRRLTPTAADETPDTEPREADPPLLKLAGQSWAGRQTVLLYEESDLVFPEPRARAFRSHTLAGALERAATAEARGEVIRHALRALGFDWMVYGAVTVERQVLQPRAFLCSYANRTLLQRYFSRRHHEVDPFLQDETHAAALPAVWTVDELRAYRPLRSERGRAYVDDLASAGVGSGVSFDVPGSTRPQERCVFSLLSSDAQPGWLDDGVLEGAVALAGCLHHRLSRDAMIRPSLAAPKAALSQRQIEILELLAKGNSDRRIAEQLGLSAYAIDYHMRQLRRHFGVRNRIQLVNAAAAASVWPLRSFS